MIDIITDEVVTKKVATFLTYNSKADYYRFDRRIVSPFSVDNAIVRFQPRRHRDKKLRDFVSPW